MIPEKYKKNIFYKTFNRGRILYFKNKEFFLKKKIYQNFKKRIVQEKILFKEFGFKNFYIRFKNKFNNLKFTLRLNKIKKEIHTKDFKILIVSGCENTGAEIHRVFHLSEKLKLLKIKHKIVPHSQLDKYNPNDLLDYSLIWMHRVAIEKKINGMVTLWKSLNIPIVYDIDDLVFDETIIPYISAIKGWSPEKIDLYRETMNRYSKLIQNCDYVSSPTQFLSKYLAKKYNKPYFVVRNGLDQKTINQLINIKNKKHIDNKIIIGYFSGTNTHDKDFKQCSKALVKIISKHKNVFIKIVGELIIPKEFKKYPNQILKHQLVPYNSLYKEYREVDINIAPLELNNPYCESKSELKYYFAGFCKIPTVASPTDCFKFCIEDSINGCLAKTQKDWYSKLEKLISNKNYYKKIANNAYEHSMNTYTPKKQSKELKTVIESIKNETQN